MGAAAYNRGSLAISRELDEELPNSFSQSIRSLDETPRDEDAVAPFDTGLGLTLDEGNGGWWLTCNKTGFGYWAKTARALLKRHLVYIAVATQSPLSIQCRPWPDSALAHPSRMRAGHPRNTINHIKLP